MRPTLKEIAEATGYSIATVSRALNGSPRITPETRRSVLACARRTGYRTACRRVALIVPGYQFDGYFGSVLRLLAAELGRLDYPVEVLSSTGLDVLEEHSFCGAISVMAQNGLERYWGDRHILPLVCINTRPRHLDGSPGLRGSFRYGMSRSRHSRRVSPRSAAWTGRSRQR